MTIKFAVTEWTGWTPALPLHSGVNGTSIKHNDTPDVSAIAPMLRRKLNALGRACAATVLHTLPPAAADIPLVYCSQHGDIERTLAVLLELAESASVSPNNFSLAVHNAVCGVLSIHAGLTGPINAIAAGEQALVPVLLEAAGLLSADCPQVLCVMCDVPLPAVYRSTSSQPHAPYAMCFIVSTAGKTGLFLQQSNAATDCGEYFSPLDFCTFLDSNTVSSIALTHNGCNWELAKS